MRSTKRFLFPLFFFGFIALIFQQPLSAAYTARKEKASLEKPELVLYYSDSCPYCKKVYHFLEQNHKSVKVKNIVMDPAARAELIRVGGKKQVPCLFINGKPLYESRDIIIWLSKHLDLLDPSEN